MADNHPVSCCCLSNPSCTPEISYNAVKGTYSSRILVSVVLDILSWTNNKLENASVANGVGYKARSFELRTTLVQTYPCLLPSMMLQDTTNFKDSLYQRSPFLSLRNPNTVSVILDFFSSPSILSVSDLYMDFEFDFGYAWLSLPVFLYFKEPKWKTLR